LLEHQEHFDNLCVLGTIHKDALSKNFVDIINKKVGPRHRITESSERNEETHFEIDISTDGVQLFENSNAPEAIPILGISFILCFKVYIIILNCISYLDLPLPCLMNLKII
jgi:hypothetical protein